MSVQPAPPIQSDTHPASYPYGVHSGFSPSTERQLDEVDFRILDSLLDDVSQSHAVSASARPDHPMHHVASPAQPNLDTLAVQASAQHDLQHDPAAIPDVHASRSLLNDKGYKLGWRYPKINGWEPLSFYQLEGVRRLQIGHRRPKLVVSPTVEVLEALNSRLFAGKMTVVSNTEMPQARATFSKIFPAKRTSRKLPFSPAVGRNGDKIPIYMTDHEAHHSRFLGEHFRQRGLQGKPHFFFWGVEETPWRTNVINYGAGYIAPEHRQGVDDHLWPILQALKGATKGRV
ncbi:hypothetical protein PSEUBRA_006050 [Kalmanozyma brasiliensis GHG001]|uniref:uncharacterized protein n=1 Tax=Kalmanozyma brasiliensis (strain GHG001) TaxID=1365824 RepID=UPI001CEBA688|nr:uncharacterized protein PSEUBRA_006050 [Kalmanozyma brasiliensis GHG001]KAF6767608.1 hypothetical protein PSEUBRA_006050 [Kalmanozyma brasiliensis GHG001]